MKRITYRTGREYNGPQELVIDYTPFEGSAFDDNACDFARVEMSDASRGITYSLRVLNLDCSPSNIGPAVLNSYDNGFFWIA